MRTSVAAALAGGPSGEPASAEPEPPGPPGQATRRNRPSTSASEDIETRSWSIGAIVTGAPAGSNRNHRARERPRGRRYTVGPPMPRVSVIIVNWNGKDLLEDCFAALRQQTFRDFEVVVVDNGSRDGSVELLKA